MKKTRFFMFITVLALSLLLVGVSLAADDPHSRDILDISNSYAYWDGGVFGNSCFSGGTDYLCFNYHVESTTQAWPYGLQMKLPDGWNATNGYLIDYYCAYGGYPGDLYFAPGNEPDFEQTWYLAYPTDVCDAVYCMDVTTAGSDDIIPWYIASDGWGGGVVDTCDTSGYYACDEAVYPATYVPPCVQGPDIDVAPTSLSAEQAPDVITTQFMQVCNLGTEDLTWELTEAPGAKVGNVNSLKVPQVTLPAGSPQSLTEFAASGLPAPVVQPVAVPTGPVPEALTYYSDRAVFNAAYPGLPIEGYENGSMADGSVGSVPHPLDQYSSNAYFDPGDILPGIQFWATSDWQSDDEIAVLGTNFAGNPSKTAVANWNTDGYVIVFDPPVAAAGLDLQDFYGSYSCNIDIYDTNGYLTSVTSACNEAGLFWGVSSDAAPITTLVITDFSYGFEGGDNVAFGGGGPVDYLPWLGENPTSGIVAPATCQDVEISFDSFGLAPDVYNGALDFISNDPDEPVVSVPVQLTVVGEQVPILLVDDDDNNPDVRPYYTEMLDSLGLGYDVWDTVNSDNEPSAGQLASYSAVIWFSGHEYGGYAGPGANGEGSLAAWLDTPAPQNPCLLLSGQDYLYDRGLTGFGINYLGILDFTSDVAQTVVAGAGSVYSGDGPYTLVYPYSNFSDEVNPDGTAEVAFTGDMGNAAVDKFGQTYFTTFTAYPLEAIPEATDRRDVVLDFLGGCGFEFPEAPMINITPPSLYASQFGDQITYQTLNIGNLGLEDLVWSLWESAPNAGWSDNFDSYPTGADMHGLGGWKGWFNSPAATAYTSGLYFISPPNSVEIAAASDLVHEYGYDTGVWTYTAWQYIPTDFSGTTYFILLNQYDDGGINLNWSTQIRFDQPTATVYNDGPAGGTLPLITGQWVLLQDVIDLGNDVQTFYYNGDVLFSGSWKDGMSGDGIANIQAVDLFANGATPVYYDDLSLVPSPNAGCGEPGEIPWLCVDPTEGTTPGFGSVPVSVQFDSTDLDVGIYEGTLFAQSNDPVNPVVEVPVTLEVTAAPPDIEVTPPSLSATLLPDEIDVQTLNIANLGDLDLVWNIFEEGMARSIIAPAVITGKPDATQNRLSADGSFKAAAQSEAVRSVDSNVLELINDGSFEFGPPPGSAWTEISDTGCEWIGDWSGVWGVPAFDGIYDYWGGGYCGGVPTTSSVSQANIPVPNVSPTLSFWYISYRPDPDDGNLDYAYIKVNGTTVWTLDLIQANDTFPDFVNATVDMSDYAGQDVTLEFGAVSAGDTTGNIRFDFIELFGGTACINPSEVPWLSEDPTNGTTPGGGSTPVDVTFNSAGMEPGEYLANLCVESNDDDSPVVAVPVTLNVVEPEIDITAPPLEVTLFPDEIETLVVEVANIGSAQLDWSVTDGAAWLSEDPPGGSILPGNMTPVDVIFDSAGLTPAVYTTTVVFTSNDLDEPELTYEATLTVVPRVSDLELVKLASADMVKVGDMITYTLFVTNTGPEIATGVILTDSLSSLVEFVGASEGCTEEAGLVTCNFELDVDASSMITITVTAASDGTAINTAGVVSDNVDPTPEDNFATFEVVIKPAIYEFFLPIVQRG